MTYVLGSLGAVTVPQIVALAVQGIGIPFETVFRTTAKGFLASQPTASTKKVRYLIQFANPDISDAEADRRAGKAEYAQPYKAFRDGATEAMGKAGYPEGKGFGPIRSEALRSYLNSLIDSARQELSRSGLVVTPPSSGGGGGGGGGGGAGAASTTDNTMLYVGLAAAAVIGIGLMRRRQ